ncbi:MAG: biosynthetic-type acetolactate synthase large subunit [Treponema sp.]|jgi:acetolactate synthase-1/2/3 large subunit|nr:biosynthetic-type acetolactate synthase large subunit [Treponema sp.]
MKMKGAQIVIECLLEQGVDTVFGYPGGAILNIYDELYKNSHRIKHILTAHEQGAAHAADGYARSTGKVGVVMATSGPGATNLVTGIATAHMDSVPIVAITCNVANSLLGKDSFQEVDIRGITMPITKHSYIVRHIEELANCIREAFIVAQSGRPGPVLIDIPKDVTAAQTDYLPVDPSIIDDVPTVHMTANINRIRTAPEVSDEQIKEAAELINAAKRPVIYAGGGIIISDSSPELLALAERASIPVAVSLMAKSAFPSAHKLCTGMVGMHGSKASNMAVSKSDFVLTLGARFSDRVTGDAKNFAKNGKVFQIDIDPAEINKNVQTAGSIIGNMKSTLDRLLPLVEQKPESDWNRQIAAWKKEVPSTTAARGSLHPAFLCRYVHSKVGENAIITTEVGQHQMWVAQYYEFSIPRTFLTSGGLGTMGFGTGAAIGAQVGNPGRRVVHFAGDGSFRMNCNELATISHFNLPIIIIVINNGTLGMVRQWQNLFYGKRYSQTTLDFGPDFVKLAEAYGIQGYRAVNETEFRKAFDAALDAGKPAVIDAHIGIDEMVLPMVPAGKPIDQLFLEIK